MALDPAELARWKAELAAIRVRFAAEPWPVAPAEGLMATCRLSDDVRTFALAGLRHQHPTASTSELDAMLYESQLKREQAARRIRIIDLSSIKGR